MSGHDAFPYPTLEYGAEPFWPAANDGRLVMQPVQALPVFRPDRQAGTG
ncbi:MAG: hypothetical protein ACU85U_01030 [Gammaproteobacteria bacterium]|jgi:hypothetical protein